MIAVNISIHFDIKNTAYTEPRKLNHTSTFVLLMAIFLWISGNSVTPLRLRAN